MPVGSVCLAPLAYRGATVGHLLALAPQPRAFLPRDLDLVSSYAIASAIALANARHFAEQRALASRDPLTGLLNHREFHESVERELQRARRHGGAAAVALFDLDGFKLVNDGAGHAEGDRVLRAVAAALQDACRASDQAFRVGGDEFALLLPETGHDEAMVVANRVRRALGEVDPRVSASIGMASWPDDGGSKDVLLAHADASLYAMKGAARSRAAARSGVAADGAADAGTPLLRERLAMANRLSAKLAPVLGPERIAQVAVGELHRSFAELLAYVQRLDGDRLQVLAVGGTVTERCDVPLWSQSISQGVSGRVARTGRPALVHDTALDPDHIGAELVDPARTDEVPLRAQLAVPLRVDGRVWGVLSIQASEAGTYSSDDVLLLETVAAQVAAALHRSELVAELERARGGTSA
jgi:diguanylate cyclase (GGDEF)-like protein